MKTKKIKLELTKQEFDDLLSAMSLSIRECPELPGNPQFLAALKKLYEKLWRLV